MITLGRQECLRLLNTASIGRVVYIHEALPAALPVLFVLDNDTVVFRAAADGGLKADVDRNVVAFQADRIEDTTTAGWTVCGVGRALEVTDSARLSELARLTPETWSKNDLKCTFVIPLEYLTGQRLVLTGETT